MYPGVKMKTLCSLLVSACLLPLMATVASAQNYVVNGNFELGNIDFSSAYTYAGTAGTPAPFDQNPNTLWDEGTYSVGTNPNAFHSSWASFGDHTTGTGNMLLVNGAETPVNIWTGSLTQNLVIGQTYSFSAWLANLYPPPVSPGTTPTAPAELQFSVDGNMLGSSVATATGVGNWTQFTASFVATDTAPAISVFDWETAANGNDFALDDISIVATPEPTSWALGLVALALIGVLRRRAVVRA